MKYYTPQEVAKICKVKRVTIYKWIRQGVIHTETLRPIKGSKIFIPETEIPAYLRKNGGVIHE